MFQLMPLLLIAVGVAAFAYLWRLGETGRAAEGWAQAVGEIAESRVDTRLRPGGGDASRQEQYKAEIRYTYSYGGRDYQGSTVAFPDPGYGQSLEQAEARVARYPAGAQVRVYVNPAKPAQACLEAGRHWTVWAGLALCLVFVGAGIGLLTGLL